MKGNKDFIKIKNVKIPLYPFYVVFCICTETGKNNFLIGDGYTILKEETYDIFMYIAKDASKSTIAHEIYHVAEIIMYNIGHIHNEVPNEPMAYLIGWLTEQWEKFNK